MSCIRTAKITDAEAILIVKVRGRKYGYKGLVDQAYLDSMVIPPKRIQVFKSRIEKCEIFLVYEQDSTVLGFVCGGREEDENAPYPYEMGAFFVDPDYWGQGIGQQLFDAFIQRVGNNQCYLRTFSGSKAEKFYYKQGGTIFGKKQTTLGDKTYEEVGFVFN